MEKENQRNVSEEQVLYELIEGMRHKIEEASRVGTSQVNEEKCKALGVLTYSQNGQKKAGNIFLVNVSQNEEEVNVIFDMDGNQIAKEYYDKKSGIRKIKQSEDVELNEEILQKQIEKANESQKVREEVSTNGTAKGGEGRDLPREQKEEQKQEEEKDKPSEEEEQNLPEGVLPNLKDKISLDYSPKIRLDQIINGYYLYQVLQLTEKLGNKLPDGMNEYAFKTGYLSVVDSSQLEEIDGKKRDARETFVIQTYSGDIVELDETILEPQDIERGSYQQQQNAEKGRMYFKDGKEVGEPGTETQLTRTSLYKIPEANSNLGVSEDYFLSVDKNRQRMVNGRTPVDNYERDISFGQISRSEASVRERDELYTTMLQTRLDPIKENTPKSEEEIKQDEQLKEAEPDEAMQVRGEHVDDIVERCLEKVGDVYNRADLTEKVEKYHQETAMSDEEIEKQIVEDANLEHEPRGNFGKR